MSQRWTVRGVAAGIGVSIVVLGLVAFAVGLVANMPEVGATGFLTAALVGGAIGVWFCGVSLRDAKRGKKVEASDASHRP